MSLINLRYAMPEFALKVQELVEVQAPVDAGFKNFFSEKIVETKGFSFNIERYDREVAVDVHRREDGQVVTLNKDSEKFFIPPMYKLRYNIQAEEIYETLAGATDQYVSGAIYKKMIQKTAKAIMLKEQMLQRREELQRSQALHTGVVTMNNGDDIDFKRDASLMLAYDAGRGFDVNTVLPDVVIKQLIDQMIDLGKTNASDRYNIICGDEALTAFQSNEARAAKGDIKDQKWMELSTGDTIKNLTPQGFYAAGNYKTQLWGYGGIYKHPTTGNTTKFMDPKSIIILPNDVPFEMVYCGVPAWSGSGTGYAKGDVPIVKKAKRLYYTEKDIKGRSMDYCVDSAFVASLRKVDSVGTAQVVAD